MVSSHLLYILGRSIKSEYVAHYLIVLMAYNSTTYHKQLRNKILK